MDGLVHFELFVRRRVDAPWTLELAGEDRARIVEAAEDRLADGSAAAVRVVKETLDLDTREFKSVTLLSKGAVESRRRAVVDAVETAPHCVSPADLYTVHARERIGRLLEGWLQRAGVTPFELLHRPDLAERLDASSADLQHAVQRVAIPEAQARGGTTHDMIRLFQGLAERAVRRLLKDGRDGRFPTVNGTGGFAAAAEALVDQAEGAYRLGGAVAARLAGAGWREKVERLLELADAAPAEPRAHAFALGVVEQPLAEILACRAGLNELVGDDLVGGALDLGGGLLALTRLAASADMAALIAADPGVAELAPRLAGPAARLAAHLDGGGFEAVRTALTRRILTEVTSPRRLSPRDPDGEIAMLRVLATVLTVTAGRLLSAEEVHDAFVKRSRALVSGDFVDVYLAGRESALAQAQALVRLAENVVGAASKRAAGRWIAAAVGAPRFEREVRAGPDGPTAKLAALAALQRGACDAGLLPSDAAAVGAAVGQVGALVEADAKLVAAVARVPGPVVHRLTLLLAMAVGEAAPLGPAADRARAEILRLLRVEDLRAELAASPPALLGRVRTLMRGAGLAA